MTKFAGELKQERMQSRDRALDMILLLLYKRPPDTWRARYELLERKFGIRASRFRDIREARRSLTLKEVEGMKRKLGASGAFVPWECFQEIRNDRE